MHGFPISLKWMLDKKYAFILIFVFTFYRTYWLKRDYNYSMLKLHVQLKEQRCLLYDSRLDLQSCKRGSRSIRHIYHIYDIILQSYDTLAFMPVGLLALSYLSACRLLHTDIWLGMVLSFYISTKWTIKGPT